MSASNVHAFLLSPDNVHAFLLSPEMCATRQ
jgi:hypothetical protein